MFWKGKCFWEYSSSRTKFTYLCFHFKYSNGHSIVWFNWKKGSGWFQGPGKDNDNVIVTITISKVLPTSVMCLAKWNVWLVITLFITIVEKQRTLALTKILKKQKIKVYCNTLPKSTKSCYIVDYVKNEFQWRPIADRLHCPWCKLRVAFSFCFVHEIDVGTMREIIAFFLDPEDGNIYIGYYMSFITLFVLPIEPAHEIMVLCVLRKLILQTRMRSHPVGLDVWRLVGLFIYFHTLRLWTAKALAISICDKYHNLMSWLILYAWIHGWNIHNHIYRW